MKKIIITILIAVLICIGFVFIKNEFSHLLLQNANYGMPALIKKGKVNNLFIGSSTFRQGIDVNYLGKNDYVLSYNGAQPVLEYWILNKLINDGVKINNLYIDMYAYTLYSEPSISDTKIFMETNIGEKMELFNLIDNGSFKDLWDMFVSSNNEIFFTYPIYYPTINKTFKQGGSNVKNEGITDKKLNDLEMIKSESNINKKQKEAVEKIVKLCKKNNINLTFIEIPKPDRLCENKTYIKIMDNYKNLLEKLNAKYILADEVDNSIKNDSSNFSDLVHLSSNGKQKYTKSLIKIIKNTQ